ncbi:c-type cytochrome biogenesis protein CcmI [Mangrovitalea sediminis]|uniref:c-type cytochrome biogenesis protein CcmI n=1 Tax=Mangrovitalea sediminis TaxID=1982043 RepID=UPI000BE55DDD|nr:c-type cytochrome biogenesis protein CcmI [Mangrovitalea sediminis]
MTIALWMGLALMAALALVFVFYPVIFHREPADRLPDSKAQNLVAYRTRLAELEAEREAGVLDDEEFRALKEELDGGLLDDVDVPAGPRQRSGKRWALTVAIVSIVLIPLLAFSLYLRIGASNQLGEADLIAEMSQANHLDHDQLIGLLGKLRQRLLNDRDNLDGWVLLARSYMNLEQYKDAAWAFEKLAHAVERESGPKAAAAPWGLVAQARFFASGQKPTPDVLQAITEARSRNPDDVNALGLLGIMAFQAGDYQDAIKSWSRIIKVAPDTPQLPVIKEGIARAYERLGKAVPQDLAASDQGGDSASKAAPAGDAGPQMTVSVSVGKAYRDELPKNATLFVYAKAVKGPAMPLAVAKYPVSALPVTVTLNDGMAMTPVAKLSSVDQVMLIARISSSGSAMPASGDWEGKVGPVPVRTTSTPIAISIDHRLP